MNIDAAPVALEQVAGLRDLRRHELRCQLILDSWPKRGWADCWLLTIDSRIAGYGAVGDVRGERKDCVTEFYVLPALRGATTALFRRFIEASGARRMEVQTNDRLLFLLFLEFAANIERNEFLFEDALTTNLSVPEATFRKTVEADRPGIQAQKLDEDAGWLVEEAGIVTATGGLLFHYNVPFGDLYMAVAEDRRRRGIGSYLVQELKRACYELGRIPAARCNAENAVSRATLQRAGMFPCGRLLTGEIKGDF